jgi:serine/threonine-protein kinase
VDGAPFGSYRLIGLLGRGGMGEVWRAFDTATNRVVAVKVLPTHLAADPLFEQRFRREALAAAGLNNPHVIPIHTFGEIDGRLFVDMRLIEGRDLQAVIAEGPLEPARAVRIIEQVAKALQAAHKVGLIHRDVKPSNILLDDDDFAYLIDFGIARSVDDTSLTSTGAIIGTMHYMAPERMGAHRIDARSDIYALACVLYESLTGERPFPGNSVESQVAQHLAAPPPRPTATNPDLPAEFDAVIATGMAKKPDQRYATTVELAGAAREAITTPIPRPPPIAEANPVGVAPVSRDDPTQPLRDRPLSASKHDPPQPWWRRKAVIIAGALVTVTVVVIAIAAISIYPRDAATPLPFTGLNNPWGVAVGPDKTVYVTDYGNDRLLELAPGGTASSQLLTGLNHPWGVAVGPDGMVYIADFGSNRVLKLAAGASTTFELRLTGVQTPQGVAVGTDNTVYVTDNATNRVLKLEAGATTPVELPFTGLNQPEGVAVGPDDTVYVTN